MWHILPFLKHIFVHDFSVNFWKSLGGFSKQVSIYLNFFLLQKYGLANFLLLDKKQIINQILIYKSCFTFSFHFELLSLLLSESLHLWPH